MARTHTCGTSVPATIAARVVHLATCPETRPELAAWCRAIVDDVARDAAQNETPDETPTVSRDTTETRALSPAEMHAMHRDGDGDSLRDIARLAGVAPETVRRRIAKHKKGARNA